MIINGKTFLTKISTNLMISIPNKVCKAKMIKKLSNKMKRCDNNL